MEEEVQYINNVNGDVKEEGKNDEEWEKVQEKRGRGGKEARRDRELG